MAVKEKQKSICPEETVFGNGTCGKAQAEGKDETEESGAGHDAGSIKRSRSQKL